MRVVLSTLPKLVFALARFGPLFNFPVNSSANAACSTGVRSTVAPSCGVAVSDWGADGGGEGPAGSIGGAIGFPVVFID